MHIHILGICGTFMGGIAQIARTLGHAVTGSDENVYPPMSTQLEKLGIDVMSGYKAEHLKPQPDQIIVGNTISRGNPELESILSQGMSYVSGAEWLFREAMAGKHVLAVSGTHGKTTTTSILAWILESAGLNPGFMIGGIAENFGISARYSDSDYFVIEADEYDTAFSDKRSKFIHYHPKTLIINNIEFDHADIFHDLAAIRREFHHLLKILPEQASIIYPQDDPEVKKVLDMGCWSKTISFGDQDANWSIAAASKDYRQFVVLKHGTKQAKVSWDLLGEHNAMNGLAAIIAAHNVGISVEQSCTALAGFKSVKRRLECIYSGNEVHLYDDFAHHPTAISQTLKALRQYAGNARIIAIMEPRSNTMRMGIHAKTLASSLSEADMSLIYQADNVDWDIAKNMTELGDRCQVFTNIEEIVDVIANRHQNGDHIVIMSNGGFGGIQQKLIEVLR